MIAKEDQKPVYVINGFLDSGKSSFYIYTIGQPYFQSKGTTLLILCEEGEREYSEKLLQSTGTVLEVIGEESGFTPAKLMELDAKHRPDRILIEWNGMWDFRNFRLPRKWRLEQQITTINASTFSMYFTNMRSLIAEQLKNSELIMLNRCDGMDEKILMNYKRNLRAINQRGELIFEDAEGEVDMTSEEDLPFDITCDPIVLDGLQYGYWYMDAMEHPDRYHGKNIEFTGMIMKPGGMPAGTFIPGRMAMTCCAEDMQFLGYAAFWDGQKEVPEKSWVRIRANVRKEFFGLYGKEGIVLHAAELRPSKEPVQPVIDFSQPI